MAPLRRAVACALALALLASGPASQAVAAELGKTVLPGDAVPTLPAANVPAAAANLEVQGAAGLPAGSAAQPGAAAPAAPGSAASAAAQAAAVAGAAAEDGSQAAEEAVYDNGVAQPEEDAVEAPRTLGLSDAELQSVAAFTNAVRKRAGATFPEAGFQVRDYVSWRNFIRFYTPEYGLKEALRRGALYVYRDRLETEAERQSFDTLLTEELGRLSLSNPLHGQDAELARRLMARAEPPPRETPEDENSPFNIPLAELVPDAEQSKLIMTPTVLNRLDSVMQAYHLRDYTLMVGPPATVKSALPRYVASHFKIPFLAVTMHPGIGTFELVGGYRPRELKIRDLGQAAEIVRSRLKLAQSASEHGAFIDAASKVYGAGDVETLRKKAQEDLAALADPAAARRVVTLAHALRYGESSLVWQDGYLTYAIKRDIWINFEELNAAPTEVLEFLNEFMRSRRLVVSQKLGKAEVLTPKPGGRFMLWATMNPESDSNRNVLARTLKSRWRIKQFGPLPSLETAQILEQKFGLPNTWALALAENIHKPLAAQAHARVIGDAWRDGYVYNLRHLLRVAKRWRYFVEKTGARPDSTASLALLAREAQSVYSAQIREPQQRAAIYTMLDQALQLHANGVTAQNIAPAVTGFQDLGDRIRVGDVEIKKGPGGPLTPAFDPDYVVNAKTWPRLYEFAKALAMGEPLLLMGESGAGKTTDLEYLFHILNYPLHYKNLDSDTAYQEVVGGYVTGDRRGVYVFAEGMLPRAIDAEEAVLLDEINLNPLAEWMNTLIDDGSLYLPHRIVRGHPFLTGAANPPEPSRYGGRLLMSPAFRSRWHEFWVDEDVSDERFEGMMRRWLGGAMAAFGRAEAGVASWTEAARDLVGRFVKKKARLK